jgi:aminopeptidase N
MEATVRQLLNRLDDATSSERIDALQELQSVARTEPSIVGRYCLQKVLEFLREQGSQEEYEESLDLIFRLVKCRSREVAAANSAIILADKKNVELLLDLLEHETMTVGVMASQILTEIHSNDSGKLENQIQDCPAGTKYFYCMLRSPKSDQL